MNAEQARKISNSSNNVKYTYSTSDNHDRAESIYKMIREHAKFGLKSCFLRYKLPKKVIKILEKDGYTVEKHFDMEEKRTNGTIISWR